MSDVQGNQSSSGASTVLLHFLHLDLLLIVSGL